MREYASVPRKPAEAACKSCGGNDGSRPCAYPGEGKHGCLRDLRRSAAPAEQRTEPTVDQSLADWHETLARAEQRTAVQSSSEITNRKPEANGEGLGIAAADPLLTDAELETIDGAGVAWCTERTFARLVAQAKLANRGSGEPVAWGYPNTAITGKRHALMMVRLEIPSDDQYGGKGWLPLYLRGGENEADQTVAALRAEVERLTKENKFLNAENLELEATQQACKSAERRLAVAVGALIRIARVTDSKEGDRFLVMCIANEALQELK